MDIKGAKNEQKADYNNRYNRHIGIGGIWYIKLRALYDGYIARKSRIVL